MNCLGSTLPLIGSTWNWSIHMSPSSLNLKLSLFTSDWLYSRIIRCSDLLASNSPKSISSIEKNTLLPIGDTSDLAEGISYTLLVYFLGGFLKYPNPSTFTLIAFILLLLLKTLMVISKL